MSDNNNTSSGIGFAGALFITFLVLKLTSVINWSLWWVTAPLWGPVAIVLVGGGVYFIVLWMSNSRSQKAAPKPMKSSKFQQRISAMQNEQREKQQMRDN